jgi:hypothetical protein
VIIRGSALFYDARLQQRGDLGLVHLEDLLTDLDRVLAQQWGG